MRNLCEDCPEPEPCEAGWPCDVVIGIDCELALTTIQTRPGCRSASLHVEEHCGAPDVHVAHLYGVHMYCSGAAA